MVGIISNIAALNAQTNLEKATAESQSSISRLSSGERIAKASDDVAGLAVGTILKTNVATLRAAYNNTAQAGSLLGVADGAVATIADILQRQKALASQATSGSLTDSARGFLDQEFQNLVKEIDRVSDTTNFNGIKLIDGSLFAANQISTDTRLNATQASAELQITAAMVAGTDDDATIAFEYGGNTATITARPTAGMGTGDDELNIDITANSTAAQQASAIKTAIDNVKNYQGTTAAVLAAKAVFENFDVSVSTDTLTIKSKATGTLGNAATITTAGLTTATVAALDGVDVSNGNGDLGDAGIVAIDGALNSGSHSTTSTAYNGTARTVAQGSVSDSILRSLTATAAATSGINLANVSNNKDFVGTIQGFEADYIADGVVNLSVKVGDFDYLARNVQTAHTANTIVTLSSVQDGGGSFDVQFAANQGVSSVTDQSKADLVAERLNKAFEKIEVYQKRDVTNYTAAGTVYPTGSTTASGDLAGSKFWLYNSDFSDVKVEDVRVVAPAQGGSQAKVMITIDGEVYESGYDFDGSVLAGGIGTSITNTSGGGGDGIVSFVSNTNSKNVLVFQYASATNLSISNDSEAEGLQKALQTALGVNSGASGVNFQVGTTADDNIGVQIKGTNTTDIFLNASGVYESVSVSSKDSASAASTVIDNAIQYVTAVRATVGALQSRFGYAANNIQSAIQNQDAARGTFLDTDISSESTNFAQSQVRIQASISVLAQANQLPQSLLKLIG